MSAYIRLLDVAARDYIVMLTQLGKMQSSLTAGTDVLLCIDDDGSDMGWTIMLIEREGEVTASRVCGIAELTFHSDLKRALNSLLNQCLQRFADLNR